MKITDIKHSGGTNGREVAILHLDIVGSTQLVKRNLHFAHHQIVQLYRRISDLCIRHSGIARELRGDAVVAEFDQAQDAVNAAVAIQSMNKLLVSHRFGRLNPPMRIGISYGEVISDINMITGLAVIRAQRLEQLADTDQILVDDRVKKQLSEAMLLQLEYSTQERLKGIDEPAEIYRIKMAGITRQMIHTPAALTENTTLCAI